MIVGTGTGRCGTASLAHILGLTHERHQPRITFKDCFDLVMSEYRDENIPAVYGPLVAPDGHAYGGVFNASDWNNDCSCLWLWAVPRIIELNPDAKIVCMWRPLEDTVASFLRWPRLSELGISEAEITEYVERCWTQIMLLYETYSTSRFFIMDLGALNDAEIVENLCNWCGVPFNPSKVGTHLNATVAKDNPNL